MGLEETQRTAPIEANAASESSEKSLEPSPEERAALEDRDHIITVGGISNRLDSTLQGLKKEYEVRGRLGLEVSGEHTDAAEERKTVFAAMDELRQVYADSTENPGAHERIVNLQRHIAESTPADLRANEEFVLSALEKGMPLDIIGDDTLSRDPAMAILAIARSEQMKKEGHEKLLQAHEITDPATRKAMESEGHRLNLLGMENLDSARDLAQNIAMSRYPAGSTEREYFNDTYSRASEGDYRYSVGADRLQEFRSQLR